MKSATSFHWLLAVILCAVASCSSTESYYLLSPQVAKSTVLPSNGIRLGVGPVLLPDYIDRSEIVFQSSPNKFEIPPGHLWAGSLKDTMLNVTATNLSRALRTPNVRSYPWEPGTQLDYAVAIDVHRFHSRTGGDAVLEVTWRLYDETTRQVRSQRNSTFERPLQADGYDAVVTAQSLLLKDLAEEIAETLAQL